MHINDLEKQFYIESLNGTLPGGGGVPNPDAGVLADNEMLKGNVGGTEIVGTGDTNTDTEVNFGVKNVITDGIMGAGAGTFRLGDAHDDSSGGENKITTNRVSGVQFNPAWVNQDTNEVTARKTIGTEQELTQEASKADVLIDPVWTSNPIVDWRVIKLTFEAETTQTNCVFKVFKNGQAFYNAKLGTLTADVEQTIDLKIKSNDGSSRVPVDAFAADSYTVSVTSATGSVRLKGSLTSGIPFFKVGYFEFEDKISVTEDDIAYESTATSVIDGGIITEASPTTVDISAGTGRVVSIDGSGVATVTLISWPAQLGVAITNIATQSSTRFAFDVNGTLAQLPHDLTPASVRDYAHVGLVGHALGIIGNVTNTSLKTQELYAQSVDTLVTLGVTRRSGLAVSPNTLLTLNKSAGVVESPGGGTDQGGRGQNIVNVAAESPVTFTSFLGLTDTPVNLIQVSIDPANYDNGSGTPVAIGLPASQSTIQYVYQSIEEPDGVFIMYGQTTYATLDDAILNAPNDEVQIPQLIQQASNMIARIVVRSDATDLTAPAQAAFLGGVKFGVGLDGLSFGTVSGGGDYFGAGSSTTDEIHTFADASGKTGKSGSDISATGGVLQRLATNQDLTLTPNGTGAIVNGSSRFVTGDPLNYPVLDGADGDYLSTDGTGNLSFKGGLFTSAVVPDTAYLSWLAPTGATSNSGDNLGIFQNAYRIVNENTDSRVTISSPSQVTLKGRGVWRLTANIAVGSNRYFAIIIGGAEKIRSTNGGNDVDLSLTLVYESAGDVTLSFATGAAAVGNHNNLTVGIELLKDL